MAPRALAGVVSPSLTVYIKSQSIVIYGLYVTRFNVISLIIVTLTVQVTSEIKYRECACQSHCMPLCPVFNKVTSWMISIYVQV